MTIHYDKPIDRTLINILAPQKTDKGLNYSTLSYDNDSLLIQVKGVIEGKNTVKIKYNGEYVVDLIKNIQEEVSNKIFDNSEDFFNGKKFSLDKISSSLTNFTSISKNGELLIHYKGEPKTCIDYFGNPLSLENIKDTVCYFIFDIEKITYLKSVIIFDIELKGIKQCKIKEKKKVSFLEESLNEEDNFNPKSSDDLNFF